MKLSFMDRMLLFGILPEKGSLVTLKLVRELREELSPSLDEIKEMEISENPETHRVVWNADKDTGKEININSVTKDMIVKTLKSMDEKEELTAQHLSLCDLFLT